MHAVVFGGAGAVGRLVVHELVHHHGATVLVADHRQGPAQAVAAGLDGRAEAAYVDAERPSMVTSLAKGADVAVGCIGPFHRHGPRVARAVLAAGVPYLDLCDDHEATPDILGLDRQARQARVSAITGLGATPGLTNVMAKAGYEALHGADRVQVAWAAGARADRGLAGMDHLLHTFTGKAPRLKDGRLAHGPAGQAPATVAFPDPLGEVEVSRCGHPEPTLLSGSLEGLSTVDVRGGLVPALQRRLLQATLRSGLLAGSARESVASSLLHAGRDLWGVGGPTHGAVRVDVAVDSGQTGNEQAIRYHAVDQWTRLCAIPAATGAAWLARGKVHTPGVHAPEAVIDPEPFFRALAERGLTVQRQG